MKKPAKARAGRPVGSMKKPLVNLGTRLKSIRLAQGLSQSEIIRRSKLAGPYVSRVENGLTIPSVRILEQFADAFGIELYQIFYDGPNPTKVLAAEKACEERIRQLRAEQHERLRRIYAVGLRLQVETQNFWRLVQAETGIMPDTKGLGPAVLKRLRHRARVAKGTP
jgi:transcriptional regulator with XRE-family HTH domain